MHCLPVVYQLTILLMECLAEHTIVTFASCFSKCDESDLDKAALNTLRESIITLIEAAGHRKESLPSSLNEHASLCCASSRPRLWSDRNWWVSANKAKNPPAFLEGRQQSKNTRLSANLIAAHMLPSVSAQGRKLVDLAEITKSYFADGTTEE